MSTDAAAPLGAAIRRRRLAAGRSLRAAARAAGVSPSFFSQVENGISRPGLETLNRIAGSVGSTAQALLAEANAPTRSVGDSLLVVRADVGLLVAAAHEGDGAVRSLVDASAGFEAMEIRGAPDRFGEAYCHAGIDLLYVVTGEIETEIGGKRRRLGPRDAITYSGDRPHRTRRLSGDVHLIIVTVR